jgi:hypothetical protein
LVLTPDGFALWLNTTIYACFAGINRKFRPSKKPNLGFFAEGLSQMTQPLLATNIEKRKNGAARIRSVSVG